MDFTNCRLLHFCIETFENGECVGIRHSSVSFTFTRLSDLVPYVMTGR